MLNMKFTGFSKSFITAVSAVVILFAFSHSLLGQVAESKPELSVAGIQLGNRASAESFLSKYTPRINDDGSVSYWFYNKFGTQVMMLTAVSADDPHFITEIKVFAVDSSYVKKHYVAKDVGFFVTENGIFIGYRQSALSIIVGVPNAGREDRIGPRDVIRKKGTPAERVKEDKIEKFTYNVSDVRVADMNSSYQASYRFYKNQLNSFEIKLINPQSSSNKARSSKTANK